MAWTIATVPTWTLLVWSLSVVTGCSGDDSSADAAAESAGGSNSSAEECDGALDLKTVSPVEPCAGDPSGHWLMERFDWPSMPIRFRYYLSDPTTGIDGNTTSTFREGYCFGEVIEIRGDLDLQFTIDDQGAIVVSANPLDVTARHLDSCSMPVLADETEMNDGSCEQFDKCTLDCGVCTCNYFNDGSYTYASVDSEASRIIWDLWGPDDRLDYCVEGDSMRLSSSRGLLLQMRRM